MDDTAIIRDEVRDADAEAKSYDKAKSNVEGKSNDKE